MKSYQQVLSSLFVLALTTVKGQNIEDGGALDGRFQCYNCSSFENVNCETINELTPKANCTEEQTLCRKVEQHMYYNKEDHVRIFRQCATRGSAGDCDSRTGTYRFKSWYCHCNGNLCNGSGTLLVSLTLTVAVTAVLFEVKKYL
uniref:Protein sleepless n=1 Tax=Arion vulgaris TaxID=1028688 RepID=A0A0B7B609_9EUPU